MFRQSCSVAAECDSSLLEARTPSRIARMNARLKNNALLRFVRGEDIDADNIASAVASQAFICALVMTVPYQLMGSLAFGFWDQLDLVSQKCPESGYDAQVKMFQKVLVATILTSIGGLIMSTMYFLLKPKDIKKWWPRGRIFMLFLFILSTLSIISLFALTIIFYKFYMTSSSTYCDSAAVDSSGRVISSSVFIILITALTLSMFF